MEFRELITARRSIRKYEAAISPEDLAAILRAAQQAPSWKNQQTARSYAVVTPETLEDLRAAKDMGYDTLIMGIRDAGAIREKLSIPENEEIMSVIAVGKAAEAPASRPRKAPEEVIRFF